MNKLKRFYLPLGLMLTALCAVEAQSMEVFQKDDKRVNMGWNAQAWFQSSEAQAPDGQEASKDFFLRRSRLYVNGQIRQGLLFNLQLDLDNDGLANNAARNPTHTEANVVWGPSDSARLSYGFVKLPFARQNLEAAFAQLLIDKDFIRSKIQVNRAEYDYGFVLWGSPLAHRVKYYAGIMDGATGPSNRKDSPRTVARGEIHLLDPEAPTSYEPAGTYLGAKKVLALGAAYDQAPDAFVIGTSTTDYRAWTGDMFLELPWRGGSWTFESAYYFFDHGVDAGALAPAAQGSGYSIQGGFLLPGTFRSGRLQPVARYASYDSDNNAAGSDENRYSGGMNYYIDGQVLKLQLDITYRDFRSPSSTNVALQDHWICTLGFQFKV